MKVKVNPQMTARELKGKVYLFDAGKLELHTLNETGSFVWRKAKKTIDIEALTRLVCQEFTVKEKVAKEDVGSFVKYCLHQGIFRRVRR